MSLRKETKSTLFLILFIAISAAIIYSFTLVIDYMSMQKKYTWIFYFIGYILILFISDWLKRKTQWKFFTAINIIVLLPISLLGVLFHFSTPTMAVMFNIIGFFSFSVIIPLIFVELSEYFDLIYFEIEMKLFIYLTFLTCFSVVCFKPLLWLTFKISPFKSIKYKGYKLKELTEYILNKENVRFMIYTAFFFYLTIFSIKHLQDISVFEAIEKDRAVYQSFLCFLAFDRLILNSDKFKLLPSVLSKKIITSLAQEEEKEE